MRRTVLTHAPGTILGYRRDGRAILPIAGGAPEDDDADDDTTTDDDTGSGDDDDRDDDADPDGADQLGDPGKRALDTMKAKLKAAKAELADERAKRQELERGDGEPTAEQIREQARTEAKAEALRERVLDRLEAKAARLLTDPEDARRYLADQLDDFIDDGKVDNDAIVEALNELIKTKPYLAAATAKRFQGTGDGGARKGGARPSQLTRADLKTMTPQAIDKARAEGRLEDVLNGK